MSLYYKISDNRLFIVGHTFPHREKIKAIGGRFDGQKKMWFLDVTDENKQRAHQLCESLGGGLLVQQPSLGMSAQQEKSKVEACAEPLKDSQGVAPGYTIQDLMNRISLELKRVFPSSIWVIGEIQNFYRKVRGHIYFDLAEAKSDADHGATLAVKTHIWSSQYRSLLMSKGREELDKILVDGTKVRLLVDVHLYRDRGQISLTVRDIDLSYTQGELALARQKLIKELKQKGLFHKNKQLTLGKFPLCIGLVSASGSRAVSDFLHQLESYHFPGKVILVSAHMQGEKTLSSIPRALKILEEYACDLIVVTRGGGSAADLRWFDCAEIAYAIAQANCPVVAAIGHHDDLSVAEEVAFRREKTPTAAADFILQHLRETEDALNEVGEILITEADMQVSYWEKQTRLLFDQLSIYTQNLLLHSQKLLSKLSYSLNAAFDRLYHKKIRELDYVMMHLEKVSLQKLMADQHKLELMEERLRAVDPKPWIHKGWTQLMGEKSRRITTLEDVSLGEKVKARLLDGTLTMIVDGKEHDKNG